MLPLVLVLGVLGVLGVHGVHGVHAQPRIDVVRSPDGVLAFELRRHCSSVRSRTSARVVQNASGASVSMATRSSA